MGRGDSGSEATLMLRRETHWVRLLAHGAVLAAASEAFRHYFLIWQPARSVAGQQGVREVSIYGTTRGY